MRVTTTLAAVVLATSLSFTPAHAANPTPPNNNAGLIVGAFVLGILAIIAATNNSAGGNGGTTSTKNGPDLGVDLPNQGGAVLADF